MFARGADKALWHKWQTAPNNGWSNWASEGGWIDLLDVGRNADGRMEVFARGSDGAVWHKWQVAPNSGWSGWASLGGWVDKIVSTATPTAGWSCSPAARTRRCGTSGRRPRTAAGRAGTPLGGWIDLTSRSAQNADGRIEVFARGADKALWHIWQTAPNDGWSGWTSRGRLDRPARRRPQRRRPAGDLRPRRRRRRLAQVAGGAQQRLVGLGVRSAAGSTCSTWRKNADGRLEVFARGADKALWHIWQTAPNDGWSGWSSLGGWIDQLDADQDNDGRLEVFARGADEALWHIWQTAPNGNWSGWSSLGGWIDLLDVGQNAL